MFSMNQSRSKGAQIKTATTLSITTTSKLKMQTIAIDWYIASVSNTLSLLSVSLVFFIQTDGNNYACGRRKENYHSSDRECCYHYHWELLIRVSWKNSNREK